MKRIFKYTAARPFVWVLLWGVLSSVAVNAAENPPVGSEYRVKAGFIYHFARFTQWPDDAFPDGDETPLILCLATNDPESRALMMLNNKKVRGRRISVRRYKTAEDAALCHILYIVSDDPGFVSQKIQETQGRSVLTIGDIKTFTQLGGIIRFFIKNDQLRFAVNLEAAGKAMLKFSSQLLMSAEIIQEEK